MLVLEDLVYLGWQSTFVFANPCLISGENERKATESLQTVNLQNFSCIEVMEGIFLSFVSWHVLSFERASDRLERILLIWRQNLIGHEQSIQTKPKSLKELLVLIMYRFIIT